MSILFKHLKNDYDRSRWLSGGRLVLITINHKDHICELCKRSILPKFPARERSGHWAHTRCVINGCGRAKILD